MGRPEEDGQKGQRGEVPVEAARSLVVASRHRGRGVGGAEMSQSVSGRRKVGGTWERDGRWRKMTTEDEEGGTKRSWTQDRIEIEIGGSWRRRALDTAAAVAVVEADTGEEKEMMGEKEKREWKN